MSQLAYKQQSADSALMTRHLHRTALPIGGIPAEGLESCVMLPQVVLNTLCAMFSEYCSEPFVTEPVEVVDAFGQSTGSLADRRWNASCPGCQRTQTALCTNESALHAPFIVCPHWAPVGRSH